MANIIPVWRDTLHTFPSAGGVYTFYQIVDGANVLFSGRAYPYPSEAEANIFINRIARDFVTAEIAFDTGVYTYDQPNWKKVLGVKNTANNVITAYTLCADYSYEYMRSGVQSISRPFSNIVDPRQILFSSVANYSTYPYTYDIELAHTQDGSTTTEASMPISGAITFAWPVDDMGRLAKDGDTITIGGDALLQTYKVKNTCCRYCLYYRNAFGGFDSLLIMGNSMRTDAYAKTDIVRDANNITLEFGRKTIINEITPKWKLYTDYLTDEQWQLTHHLLGSPQVYLHDLEERTITPVVITANTAEYRSYANQGKKKSYLTIECEASSHHIRK